VDYCRVSGGVQQEGMDPPAFLRAEIQRLNEAKQVGNRAKTAPSELNFSPSTPTSSHIAQSLSGVSLTFLLGIS
jgi:hypothetical protein